MSEVFRPRATSVVVANAHVLPTADYDIRETGAGRPVGKETMPTALILCRGTAVCEEKNSTLESEACHPYSCD